MVRLKNLEKSNITVECDIIPEDSKQLGHIVVNLDSGELENYSLPEGYEWCRNHVHHAQMALYELAKEKNMPDEKLLMWY
ncbi:hypothetical protein [Muricomes intestini]|jgi:hypothetical protein|uniref:hypothetical protein n=1 Tax=Muricomes intestini TaxID=1796634 RepID=UPI002FDFAD4A